MPEISALRASSSAQRGGLNHQAIEDYLKTIYSLSQQLEGPVSTTRLAEAREVKPASATGMIRRLAGLELVNYAKHQGVTLTASGEKIALEVIRHHRLIELYLIKALGFSWDEVHEEADILEHVISEKLEDRMAAVLGYPEFGPHGAPIPTKEGEMAQVARKPLTALLVGEEGRIGRILDESNGELLRYVAKLGLHIDAPVKLLQAAPFDGPLTLEVDGRECVLGFKAASSILVEQTAPDAAAADAAE